MTKMFLFIFLSMNLNAFSQGAALDFDGVDDYVSIPDAAGVNNFSTGLKFTVEFWCKVNDTSGHTFINKGSGAGAEQYSFDMYNGSLRYYVFDSGYAKVEIFGTPIVTADGWVHIAGTFDAATGEMKLYRNGVLDGSTTAPATLNSNANPLAIGAQAPPVLNAHLNGAMDDVRIWDVARTQAEIQANMDNGLIGNESNLVSYYDFNQGVPNADNTSETSLTDGTTNSSNGTLTNFTLTGATSNWIGDSPLVAGAALDFDGVDDYVSIPDAAGINNFSAGLKFTVEFWCRVDDITNNTLINKGSGAGSEQYSFDVYNGSLRYYVFDSGGAIANISGTPILPADGWVHVAGTFDAATGEMNLYKDGVLEGSTTAPATLNSNTNPLSIGAQAPPVLNAHLNGAMDEVRLWDVARTQSEIQVNMNNELVGDECNLVSYYQFNQGTANANNTSETSLTDATANNSHGTLTNFTLTGVISSWIGTGGTITGESRCDTNSPLITSAGMHTSAVKSTDVNGWTHYCNCNSELLLSLKEGGTGVVVPADGVSINIGASSTSYHATGTGFIINPEGAVVMSRSWDVSPMTQPTSNVAVRTYFTAAEYSDINTELSNQSFTPLSDPSEMWFFKATSGAAHDEIANIPDAIVLTNGSASTEEWTLGTHSSDYYAEFQVASFSGGGGGADSGTSALPVELLHFSCSAAGKDVRLEWITASELDNAGFEIERSTDASNFTKIGWIDGNGTTTDLQEYTFTDHTTQENILYYYRLKQIDFDNRFEYSDVKSIIRKSGMNSILIYPNPVKNGFLNIQTNTNEGTEIQLELFDLTGKSLLNITTFGTQKEIDIQYFPAGIYIAIIHVNGQMLREKIVIE